VEPVPEKKSDHLATATPEVDFALVLARVIDDANQDPAEFRRAIYELARIKLQREAWRRDPPLDNGQMRRLTKALETAIERVETFSSQRDEARELRPLDRLIKDQERIDPSLTADATLLAIENGATDASASQFYNGTVGVPPERTTVSEAKGPPRGTVRFTDRLLWLWQRPVSRGGIPNGFGQRRSLLARTLVVMAIVGGWCF